jgi:hypothetical protein
MKNRQVIDRLTEIASKTEGRIFVALDSTNNSWNIRTHDRLKFSECHKQIFDRTDLKGSITQIVGELDKYQSQPD